MIYIKLESATPKMLAQISNDIELAKSTLALITPFHLAEILVRTYNNDGEIVVDQAEVFLIGTSIPIRVRKSQITWHFYAHNEHNLKYIDYYARTNFRIKRNSIGVLSTNKIKAEIKAVTAQYEALKKLSDERVKAVSDHLEKVKAAKGLYNEKTGFGYILSEYAEYSFSINNSSGYIEQKITMNGNSLETFLKLTKNV